MSRPEGLRYTKDHEWLAPGAGSVTVGVTDFAQGELGDLVFVELPKVGKMVKKGESLCVVESTKAASDVYAPVSGEVVAVNEAVSSDPTLVNREPFGAGWLVRVKPSNEADLENLLTLQQYESLLAGR